MLNKLVDGAEEVMLTNCTTMEAKVIQSFRQNARKQIATMHLMPPGELGDQHTPEETIGLID